MSLNKDIWLFYMCLYSLRNLFEFSIMAWSSSLKVEQGNPASFTKLAVLKGFHA